VPQCLPSWSWLAEGGRLLRRPRPQDRRRRPPLARNTSVGRSSSVAISAIKIMQRNLSASHAPAPAGFPWLRGGGNSRIEPHGLECRTGWRMRRLVSRPCIFPSHGESSGPRPSPPWLDPVPPSPLMLIQHLCHAGAAISYFQTMAFPSFARGRSPAARIILVRDECLCIYGYCTPVLRSAAMSIFQRDMSRGEAQPRPPLLAK